MNRTAPRLSTEIKNVLGRAPPSYRQVKRRLLRRWKAMAATLEEKLAEYENDETPRRREDALAIRLLEARLNIAAEWAFKAEVVDTLSLTMELEQLPGVSAAEFKSDWMEGWLEGLLEETTDETD